MADITGLHQSTVQNLKDAGCDEEFIVRFTNDIETDKKKAVNLLSRHRAVLLDDLHGCNKKIDCLGRLSARGVGRVHLTVRTTQIQRKPRNRYRICSHRKGRNRRECL